MYFLILKGQSWNIKAIKSKSSSSSTNNTMSSILVSLMIFWAPGAWASPDLQLCLCSTHSLSHSIRLPSLHTCRCLSVSYGPGISSILGSPWQLKVATLPVGSWVLFRDPNPAKRCQASGFPHDPFNPGFTAATEAIPWPSWYLVHLQGFQLCHILPDLSLSHCIY